MKNFIKMISRLKKDSYSPNLTDGVFNVIRFDNGFMEVPISRDDGSPNFPETIKMDFKNDYVPVDIKEETELPFDQQIFYEIVNNYTPINKDFDWHNNFMYADYGIVITDGAQMILLKQFKADSKKKLYLDNNILKTLRASKATINRISGIKTNFGIEYIMYSLIVDGIVVYLYIRTKESRYRDLPINNVLGDHEITDKTFIKITIPEGLKAKVINDVKKHNYIDFTKKPVMLGRKDIIAEEELRDFPVRFDYDSEKAEESNWSKGYVVNPKMLKSAYGLTKAFNTPIVMFNAEGTIGMLATNSSNPEFEYVCMTKKKD